MTTGYAVHERDLTAAGDPDDTATVRVTIDQAAGAEKLVQRVIHFRRGRSRPRTVQGRDEIAFVVAGNGTLDLDGVRHRLEPDTGFYVRAGES